MQRDPQQIKRLHPKLSSSPYETYVEQGESGRGKKKRCSSVQIQSMITVTDVSKIEDEVKEKVAKLKPVENHFYSALCRCKKESTLCLNLRYKTEYQNKEAGREYRNNYVFIFSQNSSVC